MGDSIISPRRCRYPIAPNRPPASRHGDIHTSGPSGLALTAHPAQSSRRGGVRGPWSFPSPELSLALICHELMSFLCCSPPPPLAPLPAGLHPSPFAGSGCLVKSRQLEMPTGPTYTGWLAGFAPLPTQASCRVVACRVVVHSSASFRRPRAAPGHTPPPSSPSTSRRS